VRKAFLALIILVELGALGCGDARVAPEERLIFKYSEGIQSLHQPTYDDYFLACHPEWQEKDLSSRMAAYEKTRRSGSVTFSEDGVELIKLAILGRGGYFKVHDVIHESHRLQFQTLVKPDYISINYIDPSELPKGAILYLLEAPLGRVLALRPGKAQGPERSVLESIELSWLWTPHALGSAEWCLESVMPITSTVKFRKLQFREQAAEGPAPQAPEASSRPPG